MKRKNEPPRVAINARFLTLPPTGVARVASELLRQISKVASDADSVTYKEPTAICPAKGVLQNELDSSFQVQRKGLLTGQMWEQLELPRFVDDRWLLSLCNVGPAAVSKQLLMIHDAQVFLTPDAYSFAFRNWYRRILPILGRRARIVATVSEYSKAQLEHFGVVPKGKAIVIHNGGDHINRVEPNESILKKYNLKPKEFFLVVGTRSPHKNLRILAEAAELRKFDEFPLVVVGGLDSRVFSKASEVCSRGILKVGMIDDGELKSLYSNATALLFPSIYEGFGLPPIEAMYCGCAVIASNAASIPEVCGDAAIYASPHDAIEWAERMDQLAADSLCRRQLSEAGLRHCQQYTWAKSAKSIAAAIDAKY